MYAFGMPLGVAIGQPRVLTVSGWSQNSPNGDRVLDSTPAHMNASPSPALMAWNAIRVACSEEAQYRLTVVPGAPMPDRRLMIRPMLCACSPPGSAQPQMTSSICAAVEFRYLPQYLVDYVRAKVVRPLVDKRCP